MQFTAPALFLLATALLHCTHARTTLNASSPSLSLLPEGIRDERRNSVCLALQRLGLGGPACETVHPEDEATPPRVTAPLTQPQLDRLCPVLCTNHLGGSSCGCDVRSVSSDPFDMDQVCHGLCAESVPVSGCGCPLPVRAANNGNGIGGPETTTEPDWASLCVTLCALGEGGALCNCDLPPFV